MGLKGQKWRVWHLKKRLLHALLLFQPFLALCTARANGLRMLFQNGNAKERSFSGKKKTVTSEEWLANVRNARAKVLLDCYWTFYAVCFQEGEDLFVRGAPLFAAEAVLSVGNHVNFVWDAVHI